MTEHLRKTKSEIDGFWRAGKYDEALRCLSVDFSRILEDSLREEVPCEADAKEIVAESFQAFWSKVHREGPLSIESPTAYLWRILKSKKTDHFRELKTLPVPETNLRTSQIEARPAPHALLDFQHHSGAARQMAPGFERQSVNIIEALIDDAEIDESVAVPLVQRTLALMKPGYRVIIETILTDGAMSAADASAKFGISEVNYRVRKNRAYAQFREVVLVVSSQTGITWRGISEDHRLEDETKPIDFDLTDETEDSE